MTIKNKKKCLLATGLGLLMSVTTAVSVAKFSASAEETVVKHGPSTLEATVENGEYMLAGTLGRERAGFVIPTPINHRYELSFDYTVLVDSGEELASGNPQNRAYLITLNEYPDSENPYTANNTHVSNTVNGLQLEIRTNPWEHAIYVNAMAHNKRIQESNAALTWQGGLAYGNLNNAENELYNYLYSAFYQTEYNGVTAKEEINVRFYASDANGNKVMDGSDTHYTFALTPYVAETGELYEKSLIVAADKTKISDSGDFTKTPNLGVFIINEPSTTKEINVEMGFKNIDNGRVRSVAANYDNIPALKHGEPVQLEVTLTPHKAGDTLSDVTYTFQSMNESLVTVDANGLVTAVAQRGGTSILITTSEGNTLSIPVRLYDDVAPVITLDEAVSFPMTATQYDEVIIPNFMATDDSGEVKISLKLLSPTGKDFDLSKEVLSFMPTNGGAYVLEYLAVDPSGNEAREIKTVEVVAGAALQDWVKYETFYASAKLIENEDASVHFSGEVGTMEEEIAHQAVAWYNNPISFTKQADGSYTTVEFSYTVDYALGTPITSGNATERSRYFGMYLVEATADNAVGPDRFNWNTPGIQLIVGKRDIVSDNALVWYELRSGTTQLSRQHTTVIDAGADGTDAAKATAKSQREGNFSKGAAYMPWFEDGDARNFATKFSTGETINVKIEYVDKKSPKYESKWRENYFILTLDEWSFRIPAKMVAGDDNGFTRQAYLGFKQYSDNGIIPFDVEISKIVNGSVRKVGFTSGNSVVKKLGDEFTIDAVSYDNDGNALNDTYAYVSGNEKVVSVDANGKAVVKAIGSANIVVTSKSSGKVGIYTVNVDIDSFSIANKEIVMYLGQDKQLELTVSPNVSVPFIYSSDNPRIVAALNNGRLQAVKLGEVTVTISYFGHEESCKVRVVTKEEYLEMGYEIPKDEGKNEQNSDSASGCGASVSSVGGLLLAYAMMSGLYFTKRREE